MNWAERIITEQNIISYLRSLTSREWIETMTRILPLFPEPDQAELREVLFRVMSGEARRELECWRN